MNFNEKREFEGIEKELEALEAKKVLIEKSLLSETDYGKLTDLGKNLDEIKENIEIKELRWLELSELAQH